MTAHDWNFALASPDAIDREAYVGLVEKNGQVTLRVPHGYQRDVDDSEKPRILSELMCVVSRFSDAFHIEARPNLDGLLNGDGGRSFGYKDNDAYIGYSNLERYILLIRKLRDPSLLAQTKAMGLSVQFDHRYIACNLERAIFLPDGTPVFDHVWAPLTQIRHTSNDMVGLACWMALDGLTHLFPNTADHEISAALQCEWEELANRFADEHELNANATLFSSERAASLPLLQYALETCSRIAPPISSNARDLYQLLDELLYCELTGQDDGICGLKGFHYVWEAACLERAIEQYDKKNIFTCDYEYLTGIDTATCKRWKDNRIKVFAKNGIARRPDLVVKMADETWLIVDFKYYGNEAIELLKKKRPSLNLDHLMAHEVKAYQDIGNIESYRWLLLQHQLKTIDESRVTLELWFPSIEKEERHECQWAAKDKGGKPLPNPKDSMFGGLFLVRKPARKILSDYASKFRLMD